ncbi:polysaccharide deacetylase family protein [Flavobacterium jejuense]|uniref:Polysaccharide deacetylase family protein n=1 Tax=Flavobacterium jejuense TaxID=1544455 RepID=A0ABX0IRM2_9FLAO|nr:polysaccharide deacetylase family protein [Flavobacterium jejuense]NHN26178.1 polysaccharide deacetylase family protein [Flavobacterium jejuense]
MKKIILIWDFDGPIGQINSSYPYNFNFENIEKEIQNVKWLIDYLEQKNIKCCFAITGFSAEIGMYPFNFPDFINKIAEKGHEIASHSWKHEWIPLFKENQINKSLKRSKQALEKAISNKQEVVGFVPPHNRPMTWIRRGAFSLGDIGIWPFFKMGDNQKLIHLLKSNGYKWIRVSYKNIFMKFGLIKKNRTGRVFKQNGFLILENHYTGFDESVISHILSTNYETYTVSAHPFMFSLENKKESKSNFLNFINQLTDSNQNISFVVPSELL